MRIGYKVAWLTIGTAVLGTAILTLVGYTTARQDYIEGIDRQLTAAAAPLPHVIGEDYLQRALANQPISTDEYDKLVLLLSDLADRSRVYYLYAFAREGKDIINLATSASPAERGGHRWPNFGKPYQEPPANLLATLDDGVTRFAEYTDEFGEFRSIFVRHQGANGRMYVVGVDVSRQGIRDALSALVFRHLLAGGLVALVAAGVGALLANRIARPLVRVAQEVDEWSHRDFASHDAIRSALEHIAKHHRDEAGDLARRFVDVQDQLQTYLLKLTQATTAKQQMEHQLEIAKSNQEGLLPQELPKV